MIRSRYWLAAIVVLLAACAPSIDAGDVTGTWVLESFSVAGSLQTVAVGVNTARQPMVEIDREIRGNTGCNDFSSQTPVVYDGARMVLIEASMTASKCGLEDASMMHVESLLVEVMWETGPGIEVVIEGEQMIWRGGDIELFFRPAEP